MSNGLKIGQQTMATSHGAIAGIRKTHRSRPRTMRNTRQPMPDVIFRERPTIRSCHDPTPLRVIRDNGRPRRARGMTWTRTVAGS